MRTWLGCEYVIDIHVTVSLIYMWVLDPYTCKYFINIHVCLIDTHVHTWSLDYNSVYLIGCEYVIARLQQCVLDWDVSTWLLDCNSVYLIGMWIRDRYTCECYSSLNRKYSLHDYKKKRYFPDCWYYVLYSIQYYWIHGFVSDVFSCTWIQRGIYMWDEWIVRGLVDEWYTWIHGYTYEKYTDE